MLQVFLPCFQKLFKITSLEDVKYRLYGFKQNVVVGKKVPNFSFFSTKLNKTNLTELDGKYKLLVFWASWCVPCIAEIPILDSLEKIYSSIGLKIYPVNIDNEKSAWEKSIAKYNFSCTHLSQLSGNKSPIFKYFAFSSIPNAILLDVDNKLLLYGPEIKKYFDLLEKLKKQNNP
ncbi:MAG: TlpA family protein disulfide reductase [Chitinophagaceae bacterium]|nr:TlpA family protein disulfide reductase [Chitinophagaceae bacterium]